LARTGAIDPFGFSVEQSLAGSAATVRDDSG
jgi:hypothetical protein